MGRKIPGKKHRGIKDPLKQREKRLLELETKINAPPKNIDDQDIPKSLERVIQLKNSIKNNGLVQKKRKKKKGKKLITLGAEQNIKNFHPKRKPEKVGPIFNQKPGETHYQFWNRVNRETHAFLKETEFETKYNVEVKRNPETGEVEGIKKKPLDELDKLEKLRSKHKNINKKKKVVDTETKEVLTKSQKRKLKLLQKKQKKNENEVDEFEKFKDEVKFGDVVHAPPEIKVHPKNAQKDTNKVRCKNLLLNSILQENKSKTNKTKSIDRTGKRKELPVGERRQLEKQQKDVIAAYRLLKARKLGDSSITA